MEKSMKEYMHRGNTVVLEKLHYENEGLALRFTSKGVPYMTVSVWVDITPMLPPNQFVCKNYSENDDIDNWLSQNGIAKFTGEVTECGFVTCPIMELIEDNV